MIWPFRRKYFDEDTVDWQIEAYEWLLGQRQHAEQFNRSHLVVPGEGHFIAKAERDHALALALLTQVRRYFGIPEAQMIELRRQATVQHIANDITAIHHDKPLALGTFGSNRFGSSTVTYDPELVRDPEMLISVLAHELCHFKVPLETPGFPFTEDEYEPFTDLTTTFFGFGVFLSNTRFERVQNGNWSFSRGGGYLPQNDRVLALALYLTLKARESDVALARKYLRPALVKVLDAALLQLGKRQPDIDRLRALMQRSNED